jgi:hypothetical protein
VLDKVDRWPALALTLHLNEQSAYYYRFLYGDKETFRLAFDLVGSGYFLVPLPPAQVKGFVHYWIDSRALFHYRVHIATAALLGARNFPTLSRAEARAHLREFARHWRDIAPVSERLAVYPRALSRVPRVLVYVLCHPHSLRNAVANRVTGGADWARVVTHRIHE